MDAALFLSIVATAVSVASFGLSVRANRRSGIAVVKASIDELPNFTDAAEGYLRVRVENLGPGVARRVIVGVVEDKETAAARDRRRRHNSLVAKYLAPGQVEVVRAKGIVLEDQAEKVRVKWHDSDGLHRVVPSWPISPATQIF